MNYQHKFHAGNFADAMKHIILTRILLHLAQKPAPFRVIDTHAGAGIYALSGAEAMRTGEWRNGVARLDAPFDAACEAILAPYRAALAGFDKTRLYPGSPALIGNALRAEDRASCNEMQGEIFAELARRFKRDARFITNRLDGYLAWKAQIPPPERRGLVLVDPPFEVEDEFERMGAGLSDMGRKWPTGSAALWYPIKVRRAAEGLEEKARLCGFRSLAVFELHVDALDENGPLAACGMLVANPPWTLVREMTALLPALSARLARGTTARWRADWLIES